MRDRPDRVVVAELHPELHSCGTIPSAPSTRGPGTFGNLNRSGSRPGWQTHAWPVCSLRAASEDGLRDLLRLHQREAGRVEVGLGSFGHRRAHDPGADEVDPDPARLEHGRHRARVADDGVLRQHVERVGLHRDQPRERRRDDEDAARAHPRRERLHAEDDAVDVDADDAAVVVERAVALRRARPRSGRRGRPARRRPTRPGRRRRSRRRGRARARSRPRPRARPRSRGRSRRPRL